MLNADDPASLALASAARASTAAVLAARHLADGIVLDGDAIVRRADGVERAARAAVDRSGCLVRTWSPTSWRPRRSRGSPASTPEAMTRAVEGFTGLEHALEPVDEIGGVRFVNDSKATNVEAARRAIESFGAGPRGDHGRPVQGRRSSAIWSRRCRSAAGHGHRDRRGAAAAARGARRERHGARRRRHARRGADRVRHRRRQAAWSCSRRRARASTCSATTRERGRVFKQEALRLEEEWNVAREQ